MAAGQLQSKRVWAARFSVGIWVPFWVLLAANMRPAYPFYSDWTAHVFFGGIAPEKRAIAATTRIS
jgi:hypothetical protein